MQPVEALSQQIRALYDELVIIPYLPVKEARHTFKDCLKALQTLINQQPCPQVNNALQSLYNSCKGVEPSTGAKKLFENLGNIIEG
ncbi:hypothetical protein AAG747_06505 [Rapidithrix thailandica]|uniref:Uncharacterized protein n=1 Tax=Rapidithrix thailandica TaxID=413964 RepID=A0AAW9S896_9BACT